MISLTPLGNTIALSTNPALSSMDMPEILLTKGYAAKVSPEDYKECMRWRWCAAVAKSVNGAPQIYAVREEMGVRIYLQKFIAERIFGHRLYNSGKVLTFKNGDKLDCRRSNLILAEKRMRRTKAKIEKLKE